MGEQMSNWNTCKSVYSPQKKVALEQMWYRSQMVEINRQDVMFWNDKCVHHNKGIIDELRKGERVYQAKSGRCRFMEKNWKELHGLAERGILVEVEHAKAHRTTKGKEKMSQCEKFVAHGNEKAGKIVNSSGPSRKKSAFS